MHYHIWVMVPEIRKAAKNVDYQRVMAESRAIKLNPYVEFFHAIAMACASGPYRLFSMAAVFAAANSNEILEGFLRNAARWKVKDMPTAEVFNGLAQWLTNEVLKIPTAVPGGPGTRECVSRIVACDGADNDK